MHFDFRLHDGRVHESALSGSQVLAVMITGHITRIAANCHGNKDVFKQGLMISNKSVDGKKKKRAYRGDTEIATKAQPNKKQAKSFTF